MMLASFDAAFQDPTGKKYPKAAYTAGYREDEVKSHLDDCVAFLAVTIHEKEK